MRRLWLLVLTLGLAVTTPAFAQDAPTKANGTTVDDAPPPAHEEGAYGGVKPGEPKKDGRPIKKPRAGTLAWVGFEDGGGRARVFLMSPSDFAYSQRVEGGALIVHLDGVKRLARNVKRPLDTRFFDTPIARITVKKVSARRARKGQPARKAGVEVRIAFKNKADAREAAARTATEADGWFYLYLDVEGGGAAPADEPAGAP